eukprot:6203561-Pyramimonas_sp.AAC.1
MPRRRRTVCCRGNRQANRATQVPFQGTWACAPLAAAGRSRQAAAMAVRRDPRGANGSLELLAEP